MSHIAEPPPLPGPISSGELQEVPPRRKRRPCLRWGCIGIITCLVIITAGIISMRAIVKSKYSDDQWRQINGFETEVISLPEDWHQPATLPPLEIVDFHNDFDTSVFQLLEEYDDLLFANYSDKELLPRLLKNDPLTADEETSLTEFLADLQPLLDATSRAVGLPGYTAELDLYGDGAPINYQIFANFSRIAAHVTLRNGDALRAMEIAALPLMLTKRPPQSYLTTHMICVAVSAITVTTYHALAEQTSDTAALKRGLKLLTNLRPTVFHDQMENWRHSDVLGPLRFAAANGFPADLKPQPLVDFYRQLSGASGEYYYEWIIKNLPVSDARVAWAQQRLAALRQPPIDYEKLFSQSPAEVEEELQRPPDPTPEPKAVEPPPDTSSPVYKAQEAAAKLVMGLHPHAVFYGMALPKVEEFLIRARVSLAMYDLTRLHYAHRLDMLNAHADIPAALDSSRNSIADFLTPIPDDPFTSRPFLFSEKLNQNFSVGPDKVNNSVEIQYDATNGTTSAGDLWMESK